MYKEYRISKSLTFEFNYKIKQAFPGYDFLIDFTL